MMKAAPPNLGNDDVGKTYDWVSLLEGFNEIRMDSVIKHPAAGAERDRDEKGEKGSRY